VLVRGRMPDAMSRAKEGEGVRESWPGASFRGTWGDGGQFPRDPLRAFLQLLSRAL